MTEVSPQGLVAALARCQAKFPPIVKSHTNPAFKGSQYADVADVLAAVRPVLAAEGIAVTQSTNDGEDGVYLTTSLRYGDERIDSYFPLHVAGLNPQQVGSLLTYHRRYQLCAILGVHPEGDDDDGNVASAAPPQRRGAWTRDPEGDASGSRHPSEALPPDKPVDDMSVAELIAYGREIGVPVSGSKSEMQRILKPYAMAATGAEPFEVSPLAASDGVGDEMEGGLPATTPPQTSDANPARAAREHLSGTERMARNSAARSERTG